MKRDCRKSEWVAGVVAVTLLMSWTTGCKGPPPPPPAAPPPVAWKAPASRAQSTAQLEPLADQFTDQVADLPGSDGSEHRKLVVGALDSLIRILQLANGPDESPAFANRLGVVTHARATVANDTIPRGRMEAAENEALVASTDALDEISKRFLFDDAKLPALDQAARSAVSIALKSKGPMHDIDASDTLSAIQAVVREQTDYLIARFGSEEARTRLAVRLGLPTPLDADMAPATMPTTGPTTGPTTKLTNDPAP